MGVTSGGNGNRATSNGRSSSSSLGANFSSLAAGAGGGLNREQRLVDLARPKTFEWAEREAARLAAEEAKLKQSCTFQPNASRVGAQSSNSSNSSNNKSDGNHIAAVETLPTSSATASITIILIQLLL